MRSSSVLAAIVSCHGLCSGDVAGGAFHSAGGQPTNSVERWNGQAWVSIGAGLSTIYAVACLPNGDLFAGGEHQVIGGVDFGYAVRWDGTSWLPSAGLVTPNVRAMATLPNGDAMISGDIQRVGSVASGYVARLSTTCPATSTATGIACVGSSGASKLVSDALPWLEATYRSSANNVPSRAITIAIAGFSHLSLPLANVFTQALAGCEALVYPDIFVANVSTNGTASWQIAMPVSAALTGQQFFHQMVHCLFDPQGHIVEISSTNALALTLGLF